MTAEGRWIEFDIPWNETAVRNCPVCGRLITRRAWEFDEPEGTLTMLPSLARVPVRAQHLIRVRTAYQRRPAPVLSTDV